jgi:DNA-binding FadR family transcriptional regulator
MTEPLGGGLYSHVVNSVGQAIVDGSYPPGTILYGAQLCEKCGVSRPVVREALRTLGSMGLVEPRRQRGTQVQPRERWDLVNPFIVRWRSRSPDRFDQMRQLLELRLGVEHAAAGYAAVRMTDSQRRSFTRAGTAMRDAYAEADESGFFRADATFHRLILEGSANPIIAQFAGTVGTALEIRGERAFASDGAHCPTEHSLARHLALVVAVEAHDAQGASDAAAKIVRATINEVQERTAGVPASE